MPPEPPPAELTATKESSIIVPSIRFKIVILPLLLLALLLIILSALSDDAEAATYHRSIATQILLTEWAAPVASANAAAHPDWLHDPERLRLEPPLVVAPFREGPSAVPNRQGGNPSAQLSPSVARHVE
ncbi:MAG: hypothetical protein R3272_14735 [Candidatus Promineifilaceae bacterium]|nr:hypothetical protein [Candidatus Promineifilaceae bacterium]